ncbi:hypothetical protein AMTR_s00007p00241580 [Amborella trichopoda]|uniref:Uncharacterized protein n=1 Tax=Amborella trichopoda TaxID=13333 RepID=W1PCK1_AMBTC|nr:hypothetical protein AMTR_s00007p00241580 [Amborella trichopoda]
MLVPSESSPRRLKADEYGNGANKSSNDIKIKTTRNPTDNPNSDVDAELVGGSEKGVKTPTTSNVLEEMEQGRERPAIVSMAPMSVAVPLSQNLPNSKQKEERSPGRQRWFFGGSGEWHYCWLQYCNYQWRPDLGFQRTQEQGLK